MWRDGYAFDATAMNVRPVHTTHCTSISQTMNQSIKQAIGHCILTGSTEHRGQGCSTLTICSVHRQYGDGGVPRDLHSTNT